MRSLLTYSIAALSIMVCSLCANASWWDDLKQLSKEAIKHTSERAENAIAKGIAVEQPAQALPTDADANYAYFNEPVFLSKLVYKELGTQHANKLILVHGLGELAMQDWDSVYRELALQYHVVALDLPGFGLSAKPYGRYSPSNYARVINALAYHLGFEQFSLVGHSMGGAVSLKYAELYPERLNKLVLVSAAGILDKTAFVKQFVDFSKFISTDKYTDRVVKQGAQVNLSFLESIMLKGPQPEPLYESDILWSLASRDSPNANAALSLVAEDFTNALFVDTPTFIIWGENDPIAPIRTGHVLNNVLSSVNLLVVKGAGHVPMKSHRDDFFAKLSFALSQQPAAKTNNSNAVISTEQVYRCKDTHSTNISGYFSKLVIDNCDNTVIENSVIGELEVINSNVTFNQVTVSDTDSRIRFKNSTLVVNNSTFDISQNVIFDDVRLDIAGTHLNLMGGVHVIQESVLVLSLSTFANKPVQGATVLKKQQYAQSELVNYF